MMLLTLILTSMTVGAIITITTMIALIFTLIEEYPMIDNESMKKCLEWGDWLPIPLK